MAFKEKTQALSPIIHLTEAEGTTVTGVLQQIGSISTKAGTSPVARLKLLKPGSYQVYDQESGGQVTATFEAGEEATVFLTAGLGAVTADEIGFPIRLVYTGKKVNPKTNREYHSYQVFVDKDEAEAPF